MLVSKKAGICTLTINRPEKRNSLTPDMLSRLGDIIESVNDDGETQVVVLRGAGTKAFSAGHDISSLGAAGDADEKTTTGDLVLAIEECAVPVIAMIYGYAIGAGCALAVACDFRLAADTASLGITAAKLGVIYPPGAVRGLIDLIGVSAAKELLYTGKLVDSARAAEIKLVDRVVPAGELETVTYGLAGEIAANSSLSVRGAKKIISKLLDYRSASLQAGEEYADLQKRVNAGEDLRESKKAFLEKRKPVFKKK
ncbi:MAG: enoyl-CoA hydratase-related protein [Dehalococcoidales bacterium]